MDSKKKYDQMVEDGEIWPKEGIENSQPMAKYIWVLDFEDGKVYRYKISANYFETYPHDWNPDHEACEEFLTESGHNLTNCEWMVTSEDKPINNNLINYKTNTNNPG